MFTLGIPNTQFRRADNVLSHDGSMAINFETKKQDRDFYIFKFPEVDEYEFKKIIMLLKQNGVTTIGADDQLTERKIMKLVDLITEMPDMNEDRGDNVIDDLKKILNIWDEKQYNSDEERWHEYHMDIEELIEDYEEEEALDTPAPSSLANLDERKMKNVVRKEIRKLLQ
tara:strand:+ start:494 stop:1003 length:510 start_codon:yes stop_codon:yes gene_type:complete